MSYDNIIRLFILAWVICGFAMGGYGSYSDLPESESALELIVPTSMLNGQSMNSMNGREFREKLAAMLMQGELS